MSETISLDLLGAILRDIQAEQRALRTENRLIREELGELKGAMLTREMADRMLRAFLDHTRAEARALDARFDTMNTHFDALNARFDALETLLRKGTPQ